MCLPDNTTEKLSCPEIRCLVLEADLVKINAPVMKFFNCQTNVCCVLIIADVSSLSWHCIKEQYKFQCVTAKKQLS